MPNECAICLSTHKEPVSVPCGHIFCTTCIVDYVNALPQGVKASCPNCRVEFRIGVPDVSVPNFPSPFPFSHTDQKICPKLTYLPQKYHEYVIPSLRRVYIGDDRSAAEARLRKRLKKVEKDRDQLRMEYEKERRLHLRRGEQLLKEAVSEKEAKEKEITILKSSKKVWREACVAFQREQERLAQEYNQLVETHETRNQQYAEQKIREGVLRGTNQTLSDKYERLWQKYQELKAQLAEKETNIAPTSPTAPPPQVLKRKASSSRAKTIVYPSIIRTRSASKRESGTLSDSTEAEASLERVAKRPRISAPV